MKLTIQQCDRLANRIKNYVITRTMTKNRDFMDEEFAKYSYKYAKLKGSPRVNLVLTGAMLLDDFYVEVRPVGAVKTLKLGEKDIAGFEFQDLLINYGFHSELSKQKYIWNAFGHNVVRNGKNVGFAPPRDFLGAARNKALMSSEELFKLIREVLKRKL